MKQGLRRDYVTHEDNLHCLNGKLLVKQQRQKNFLNKHQCYTEFDEDSTNLAENRLLHRAL
ncbi:5-methylcytosine restriction system specificity protein McrC, partial [Pseudoalteromonas piscicida]|uniref:5-methylcytosine restriction system specificity protein McrC n=1 Tax=Pseudoalteromonas piscicida TaxID=43662 RepID=UPI003D334D85